jgi:hypothetical protein
MLGGHRDLAQVDAARVLGKATLRAATLLGLSDGDLARVVGTSASSISRVRSSGRGIDPSAKEGELALLFVRMYRSLDALLGDSDTASRWFRAENLHLGGVPAELVRKPEGLVHVIQYLDAMRGKL